jgi:surface antigen
MNTLQNGQSSNWTHNNIAGNLRADDLFTNSSGAHCRHFVEVLKVHRTEQNISGIACEQGGGTWCKLKPNATAACGLGGSGGGFFESIFSSIRNIF